MVTPVYYKADGSLVQGNLNNSTYYVFDPSNPSVLGAQSTLGNADRFILGNTLPTYFGALNTSMKYKNFDFGVMARFSGGNKIFNVTRRELLNQDFYNNGTEILGRWPECKQSQETDGLQGLYGTKGSFVNLEGVANSRFVEKGDFVKVDNITLGYSFDKSVIEKVSLSKFRVYVVLQNAIMFTKYTGIDPEMEKYRYGL